MKRKTFLIILLFLYSFRGYGSEDVERSQDKAKALETLKGDYLLRKTFPNSNIVILVFAGNQGRFLNEPPSFEFCKSLSKYEENQIFVRDIRKKYYQWGLIEGGNVSSTLKILEEEIASLHPKKIIVMGCSSGGYAALLFGSLLLLDDFPVSGVYSFGPRCPTQCPNFTLEKRELKNLAKYPNFEPQFSNLSAFLKDKTFEKGIFHVYCCRNNKIDRRYMKRCLNLNWINLHIVRGMRHNVASRLKNLGLLGDVIASAVESAEEAM